MNTNKHTPGPWEASYTHKIDGEMKGIHVIMPDDHCWQPMYGGYNKEQESANAKLIAATPDLLEALQGLTQQVIRDCSLSSDPKYLELCDKVQIALQAIKKATE